MSATSRASSPQSGWLISNSSTLTPNLVAYSLSKACSASIMAQSPPLAWHSDMMWVHKVVLPELSCPYISTIRPLGNPPIPNAWFKPIEPD